VFFAATGGQVLTKSVALGNKTAAPVSVVEVIDPASADPNDFALASQPDSCAGSVPPKGQKPLCQVSVIFAPVADGPRKAILDITDGAGNILAPKVTLTGTGFTGALGIKPASVAFPKVTRGQSATKTLTLSSVYTVPITVKQLAFTNTDYSIDPASACGTTLPFTVVKGAPCVITLDFTPFPSAADNGSLLIIDDAAGTVTPGGNQQTVKLAGTGTGPPPTLTPTATPTPLSCNSPTPDNCNGSCTNLQNDSSNCGSCGTACTDQGTTCQSGSCACSVAGQ